MEGLKKLRNLKFKKTFVAIISILLIIGILFLIWFLNGQSFDLRFDAISRLGLSAQLNGSKDGQITLTQLDTYQVNFTKNGLPYSGALNLDVVYCPPNIARTTTRTVVSSQITSKMTYCGSYKVTNFRSDSKGILKGDMGQVAVDWANQSFPSKALPIGSYFFTYTDSAGSKSNEIRVNVGKLDMTEFWTMDTNSYTVFDGINYAARDPAGNPRTGTVYSDYIKQEKICAKETGGSIAWRIIGSNPYMYWNPNWTETDRELKVKPENPSTKTFSQAALSTSYQALNFNMSRMKLGNGAEYFGSPYWSSYLTNSQAISNNTVYSEQIENVFNPSRVYQHNFNTSPLDSTKTIFPNGNLLYFPIELDLNDVYNMDQTIFFGTSQAGDPTMCGKLFGETAVSLEHKTMHTINFFAHKYKDGRYGVVVSLKEVYPNSPAKLGGQASTNCKSTNDFRSGNCPSVLREDYYTTRGIGLTGMRKDLYGFSIYESRVNFSECKNDPDCRGLGPIKNPNYTMDLRKVASKKDNSQINFAANAASNSVQYPGVNSAKTSNPALELPVVSKRTVTGTRSANYNFKVDLSDPVFNKLEAFQIVLDEKGGWASPSCGAANYSNTTKGGVRLMFNKTGWKLGNVNMAAASNNANMYYWNQAKANYNCNANNAYCWFPHTSNVTSYNSDSGLVVTNFNYSKVGDIWNINLTVNSNVDINMLKPYFFYQNRGIQQSGNRLTQVPNFYSSDIKVCSGQYFNPLRFN